MSTPHFLLQFIGNKTLYDEALARTVARKHPISHLKPRVLLATCCCRLCRCAHCGGCLMQTSGREAARVERCWKGVKTWCIPDLFSSKFLHFYGEFRTGHVKMSAFNKFSLKIRDAGRLTGCGSSALRARSSCGDIYENVRWHQVCRAVKRGITRCVSASRLPTATFNYHMDDDIYSHEGPHSTWVSVSSLCCQSIKHSEQSSWQLDATIGWDDAWLIIRHWSQVRPSSRCAGKVID